MKHRELLKEPVFIEASRRFKEFCKQKEYSKVTVEHYMKQSAYFMDYLASQGLLDFAAVTLEVINAYIRTLAGFTYKTVEQNICSLRAFFRFLYQEGTVSTDFALKMPMVKARKQTAIPSV
jgi:site-specific recombinase XerD